MLDGADILQTLIELYEKQESIKVTYTLTPTIKEVETNDKPVPSSV